MEDNLQVDNCDSAGLPRTVSSADSVPWRHVADRLVGPVDEQSFPLDGWPENRKFGAGPGSAVRVVTRITDNRARGLEDERSFSAKERRRFVRSRSGSAGADESQEGTRRSDAAAVHGCQRDGRRRMGRWMQVAERRLGVAAFESPGWNSGRICDEIVPADDFPSASQAGVVIYIDRQLSRHYRRFRMAYARGLEQAESISGRRFGHGLAQASAEQRLEVARALEQENRTFFELVRKHTLEGYYGSPRHGGNRDAVSWRMLGLTEPPLRGRAQDALSKGSRS